MKGETYTYFVQRGKDGPVKIGRTTNVAKRVVALSTACAEPLMILGVLRGDHEGALHLRFKEHRMCGEWFAPAEVVLAAARSAGPWQAPPPAPPPSPRQRGRWMPPKPKDEPTSVAHRVSRQVIGLALKCRRSQ